ncbi:MAG: mobile mystery protein B [Vampirovibrio sp.]
MSDLFQTDEASTPLTEEEKSDLIPSYITFRDELNAVEQSNILEAERAYFIRKPKTVLEIHFLKKLHKQMFGNVWKWVGSFRKTARNIGVESFLIQTELRKLVDDVQFWIEQGTYPPDEIATRFHHRLVWIHPFPNGNGRHARLATDLLLRQLGQARFTWGSVTLTSMNDTRTTYVQALQKADKGDISALLAFVRS